MEVGTMALSAFEAKFVENVAKAMVYAIENAVINGSGSGQPTGILTAEVPEGQSFSDALSFALLATVEGAIPVEYETGAKWCMNKKTFAKIMGLTDKDGQPVARVNYGVGAALERAILGRDVVVTPYVADGVAFVYDFSDYVLNTIYDMGISKKQDWETEDLLTKAVMSVDGKPVDNGSLVKLTITDAVSV
jgi:HK97 family phage major capsid protein